MENSTPKMTISEKMHIAILALASLFVLFMLARALMSFDMSVITIAGIAFDLVFLTILAPIAFKSARQMRLSEDALMVQGYFSGSRFPLDELASVSVYGSPHIGTHMLIRIRWKAGVRTYLFYCRWRAREIASLIQELEQRQGENFTLYLGWGAESAKIVVD